jgi:3-deoxy-manno-octulosonate cytidylyltransferase (CMP-KDO synthetase)
MNIIGVIPARYGSTRFPGKPLVMLKGKPLLQWVVEGARKSTLLTRVIVATDDERIQKLCHEIKVDVVMTGSDCPTGTDRLFQATKDINFDVAINIQGDEPLIDETYINPLAEAFLQNPNLDMATLAHGLEPQDIDNPNAVKVIKNQNSEAIYFSRFAIPYSRKNFEAGSLAALKHIGLYGYTKAFLQKFCSTPPTELELNESLEQLRALYLGAKIKVIQVEKPTYGVDTEADLRKLEALLK